MACLTPSIDPNSASSRGVIAPFVAVNVPESMTSRRSSITDPSKLRPEASWSFGSVCAVTDPAVVFMPTPQVVAPTLLV
jgi:hypothetical protein